MSGAARAAIDGMSLRLHHACVLDRALVTTDRWARVSHALQS